MNTPNTNTNPAGSLAAILRRLRAEGLTIDNAPGPTQDAAIAAWISAYPDAALAILADRIAAPDRAGRVIGALALYYADQSAAGGSASVDRSLRMLGGFVAGAIYSPAMQAIREFAACAD